MVGIQTNDMSQKAPFLLGLHPADDFAEQVFRTAGFPGKGEVAPVGEEQSDLVLAEGLKGNQVRDPQELHQEAEVF